MTDEPAVDFERLRYIELRGDGSKLPAKSWGGYSQDFGDAEHVQTHEDVDIHPRGDWGIVDVESPDHSSFALLIFDIDIHKAPDGFDVDRVEIPTDTLVTRSQNGGFHVYFVVNGCERGALNESDFQMTDDPGFDIDIRGSSVSHHVVAPADIPGVTGDYEIVNDQEIAATFEPAEAARRIHLDGEPLLKFEPDNVGIDYEFDVPTEPPDEMPTCYHAGLELRKAAPDDHPNTHKVNMLTAACGLAAGYDPDEVGGHFCGEYAPVDSGTDLSDKEQTAYQVRQIERAGYSPPSEQTLRDYGILSEGEGCDGDCPIDYHGHGSGHEFDVLKGASDGRDAAVAAEAKSVAGGEDGGVEVDGGSVADAGGDAPEAGRSRFERFRTDVHGAIAAVEDDDDMTKRTARHRIAQAFQKHYNFVYPEQEVRGWRTVLYVYDDEHGIYEPRGADFVKKYLERAAGDFTTNQVANEIVAKLKRMSTERGAVFEHDPERICVANGVLDLHTGECDSFSPAEYHRQKLDVAWDPDAGEPEAIDQFLHEIVEDKDVTTLYRLIAHTVYKEYIDGKAAILIGGGENGKSVFLDVVEQFLGSYNVTHRELQDFDEDGFAANNLEGKLANLATEIGEQQLNDTTTFKKLTGRDTIDAQVKFEKPLTFENYATLMFATNEMPVFGQDNHAIWRRWVYVDFPYTFDGTDPNAKDPEPKDVLMRRMTTDDELEALLVRCQQEIQRWHDDPDEEFFADAMPPDEVRDKMKKAAEPVFNFASTCLTVGDEENTFVEKSIVRAAYRAYADEEDLPTLPENTFGERLVGLRDFPIDPGQRRIDGSHTRVYNGIELSSRGRQVLGIDHTDDEDQAQVDDGPQATEMVMDELRKMVEENDKQPVPREGVVWRVSGRIGKVTAERALDSLTGESGRVMEGADGLLPTN